MSTYGNRQLADAAAHDPDMLVAKARALQPALRARIAEANKRCDVHAETIADFRQAGLFKALRSSAYGGFEADPRLFFDIQNAIAEACISSAWVYGVLSVQYLVLVTFAEKAQAEVSAENPETLVSSAFLPTGTVKVEDGGFRLSGCWSFSSGSTHADWALVGGLVPPQAGKGAPEMRLFLVPKGDYRIKQNWDTFGLCATGSNDIVIENAFVPAYRTVVPKMSVVPLDDDGTNKAPLHRVPWYYVFTASITNLSIGGTRGALRAFVDAMQTRLNFVNGKPLRDDPNIQGVAARALAEADVAEATIRRHIGRMLEAIHGGNAVTTQEGLQFRAQLGAILTRLTGIVDAMQNFMGGRGIRNDSPLTRFWLDLTAARHHPGNNPAIPAGALGATLFDAAKVGGPAGIGSG